MKRITTILLAFIFVALSCNKKMMNLQFTSLEQVQASIEDIAGANTSDRKLEADCNDNLSYAPDDPITFTRKNIRVNFHVMDSKEGGHNFPPEIGNKYLVKMLRNANERLQKNFKMNLPIGNDTPILDPGYRYKLTPNTDDPDDNGIYYHRDDELYYFINKGKNRNNFKRDVIKKYGVNRDSILNIFILPHHPDSIKSKKYKGGGTGIALGTSLKVAGLYDDKLEFWAYATLLNHEIGHILGLNHSWYKNDGCEDTPPHSNCWSGNGRSPCDGEVVSNNVMDYNASQMAFSPCQLGIVHKHFARLNADQRGLIESNWCDFDSDKVITITKDTHWTTAKDLNRNIIIESGSELIISCRLSMAKGATILVRNGGKLTLNDCKIHNACGDKWGGIKAEVKSKKKLNIALLGDVLLEDIIGSNSI